MKTAMQILIDYAIDKYGNDSNVANDLICQAMILKKKEKLQIIESYEYGNLQEDYTRFEDALNYYEETYKK